MRLTPALLLALASCTHLTRVDVTPSEIETLDHGSPYLKVHMKDGGLFVLGNWSVNEAARKVTGTGEHYDAQRRGLGSDRYTINVDDVAIFETNTTHLSPSIAVIAVLGAVTASIGVYCAENPKACFGSCPTFYVWDGEKMVLSAEGFSDAVAPSLEATDVDALWRAKPDGRHVVIKMTNEALETHVVKDVQLLAAPRKPGERVLSTGDGFFAASSLTEPTSCLAPEGDCLAGVRAVDGVERFSDASATDLAEKETIDLAFPAPTATGDLGLVIGARQSLLSTFVFYQMLSYMGSKAGDWITALELADQEKLEHAHSLLHVLGGIEVLVPDHGPDGPDGAGWKKVGEVDETGPIAEDVHLVKVPAGTSRVRLRLGKGSWRLDWVSLAALDGTVEPVHLSPTNMKFPVISMPGDARELAYDLPGDPAGYELFLQSRGYYLEWMRQSWIAGEDPARALELVIDPGAALKRMAPEFKQHEADMDRAFWGSRYAHP
jgi:hypothetical protein